MIAIKYIGVKASKTRGFSRKCSIDLFHELGFSRLKLQKSPACRKGGPGRERNNYFADITGAGAGAGDELGQQEAAANATAAAAMMNLTVFMGW